MLNVAVSTCSFWFSEVFFHCFRPGSEAVLFMCRAQLNKFDFGATLVHSDAIPDSDGAPCLDPTLSWTKFRT